MGLSRLLGYVSMCVSMSVCASPINLSTGVTQHELESIPCYTAVALQPLPGRNLDSKEFLYASVYVPQDKIKRECATMADKDKVKIRLYDKQFAVLSEFTAQNFGVPEGDEQTVGFDIRRDPKETSHFQMLMVSVGKYNSVMAIFDSGTGIVRKTSFPVDTQKCGPISGGGFLFKYSMPTLSPNQSQILFEETCTYSNVTSWIYHPISMVMNWDLNKAIAFEPFGNAVWIDDDTLMSRRSRFSSYLHETVGPEEFGVYRNTVLDSTSSQILVGLDGGEFGYPQQNNSAQFPTLSFTIPTFMGSPGPFLGVLLNNSKLGAHLKIMDRSGAVVFEKEAPKRPSGIDYFTSAKLKRAFIIGKVLYIELNHFTSGYVEGVGESDIHWDGLLTWDLEKQSTEFFVQESTPYAPYSARPQFTNVVDESMGIAALFQKENRWNHSNVNLPNEISYGTKKMILIDLKSPIQNYQAVDVLSCPSTPGYVTGDSPFNISTTKTGATSLALTYSCRYWQGAKEMRRTFVTNLNLN